MKIISDCSAADNFNIRFEKYGCDILSKTATKETDKFVMNLNMEKEHSMKSLARVELLLKCYYLYDVL